MLPDLSFYHHRRLGGRDGTPTARWLTAGPSDMVSRLSVLLPAASQLFTAPERIGCSCDADWLHRRGRWPRSASDREVRATSGMDRRFVRSFVGTSSARASRRPHAIGPIGRFASRTFGESSASYRRPADASSLFVSAPHRCKPNLRTAWYQVSGVAAAGVDVVALVGSAARPLPEGSTVETLARGRVRIPYRLLRQHAECSRFTTTSARQMASSVIVGEVDVVHVWPCGALADARGREGTRRPYGA